MANKIFYLYRPVADKYKVSLPFGKYPEWITKRFGLKNHKGIDFAVPVGVPVMSVIDGVVVKTISGEEGYGNYVIVKFSSIIDYYALYAHLSKIKVFIDDKITKETVIGLSGNSGYSSGPHLHFELREKQNSSLNAIDPRPYMKSRGSYA